MPDKVLALEKFNPVYSFPCMYSGFVPVDLLTDSHLFYWFYRDEALSDDAPLLLWLNGGPGASSQLGSLMELGPLRLVETPEGETEVHSLTGVAWTEAANIIFLDQPVGVGYSYGDLVYEGQEEVSRYTLQFLLEFFKLHPEMKDRDFFITGESYGGKYQPNIAKAILEYNILHEDDKIELEGMIVGNGYVDPLVSIFFLM